MTPDGSEIPVGPPPGMRSPGATPAALPHDVAVVLHPLVRRITAANPSAMTGPGTNTYLVGDPEGGPVVVIDAGPDLAAHLDAVVGALGGVDDVVVVATHHHPDHLPGSRGLADRLGVPLVGFGPPRAPSGEYPVATVDRRCGDGEVVTTGDGWRLVGVHTPGHASDHLCLVLEPLGWWFTGDHVMSGSTVVISPPDGHLGEYLDSLAKVVRAAPTAIAPAHGDVIADPVPLVERLIAHRRAREDQIEAVVAARGPIGLAEVAALAYPGVVGELAPRAQASARASLDHLVESGRLVVDGVDDPDGSARWRRAG